MSSVIALSSSPNAELPTYTQSIQANWSISSDEEILPPSLRASVPFSCLSAEIIEAVYELSTLTVGQQNRAHSMLNTYFQARIREGSYSGKNQSIFAILEIGDVEKACESVRRMTRGRELQGPVPVKRKYSIRDELAADEQPAKLPKLALEDILEVEDEDNDITTQDITLPHTPNDASQTLPPIPATPRTKRRVRLPPIKTHALHTPILPASSVGFTPLFNNLKKEVGLSLTPSPYQQIQPDPRIRAAQRATHEFNVRRLELVEAQLVFEDARRRFEGARRGVEKARRAVGWR
jgi:hypothetical protein